MKKLISSILIVTAVGCYSQQIKNPRIHSEIIDCSTTEDEFPPISEEPWFNNRQILIDKLKSAGLELPRDYFENLDRKGLYKGKRLKLGDLMRKSKGKILEDEVGNNSVNSYTTTSFRYIPVVIWDHSPNVFPSDIEEIFVYANNLFRENYLPVEFYIKEYHYIHNSVHGTVSDNNERETMWTGNTYKDPNAMNFHIVYKAYNNNGDRVTGIARVNGKYAMMSTGWSYRVSTFAHELGHNFSLRHTHHGDGCISGDGDNADCNNCKQEPVSRTKTQPIACGQFPNMKKCDVNGDGFCDTPGDPNLSGQVLSGCVSTGLGTDNWGESWVPDTENLMSYSLDSCRSYLSFSQVAAMLNEADNKSFVSTSHNTTISGPSEVCPNTQYTYSLSYSSSPYPSTGIEWKIPNTWTIISGNGTSSITIETPSFISTNYLYATIFHEPKKIRPLKVESKESALVISGPSTISNDGFCNNQFTATYYAGSSYSWSVSASGGGGGPQIIPAQVCAGQNARTVTVKGAGFTEATFNLNVTTTNECGVSVTSTRQITVSPSGGGTPAYIGENVLIHNENEIRINNGDWISSNKTVKIENIKVYNAMTGRLELSKDCLKENEIINSTFLRNGLYVLVYEVNNDLRTAKFYIR